MATPRIFPPLESALVSPALARPRRARCDIYYIIILPLFGFKRGYDMKDQSDFILTEIKRCYNSNDRWKFILFLIISFSFETRRNMHNRVMIHIE